MELKRCVISEDCVGRQLARDKEWIKGNGRGIATRRYRGVDPLPDTEQVTASHVVRQESLDRTAPRRTAGSMPLVELGKGKHRMLREEALDGAGRAFDFHDRIP